MKFLIYFCSVFYSVMFLPVLSCWREIITLREILIYLGLSYDLLILLIFTLSYPTLSWREERRGEERE